MEIVLRVEEDERGSKLLRDILKMKGDAYRRRTMLKKRFRFSGMKYRST